MLWELSLGCAGSKEVGRGWGPAEGEGELGSVTVTSLPVPQGLSPDTLQSCPHLRPLCLALVSHWIRVTPSEGHISGQGALGSWGGFSENVQGDHGSRARLLHRALEVGTWEHTIAPITHMLPRNLCGCTCMCAMQPCVYCYVMHVFPETAEDVEGFSHLLLRPRVSPDSVSCTSELHSPRQEWSIHWKLVFRKTNVFILVNRLLIKFPMPCSSSWGCLLQAVGVTHSWPLRPRVMFWTVTNAPQCGHFSNFSSRLWASSSWGQWVIQSYSITDGLFHLLFFYLWLPRWAFLW